MKQNFNQNRLKLVDAITQLQNQITNLKEDLQRYQDRPTASEKYVFFKQQQIKVLENVAETFTENMESNNQAFQDNQKEIAKLNTDVFKLQGICLYHGIIDINRYMRIEKNKLIAYVQTAFKEKWYQIPFGIMCANDDKQEVLKVDKAIVKYIDLKNKALEK
jgi:hypothetical protein